MIIDMSDEKIRILTVKGNGQFTAGPKAPSDIIDIIMENYNAKSTLLVSSENVVGKILYRLKMFSAIVGARMKNEVLIMQFPMYETTNLLNKLFLFYMKFLNKEKTLVLIHDLDSIRSEDPVLKQQELDRLKKVNYIVSHNEKMTKYLKSEGIKAKIYNLEIFDYLCDNKDKFIRSNKIDEKNNLDLKDYNTKQENIKELQKKVRKGYFTKRAVDKFLKDIDK